MKIRVRFSTPLRKLVGGKAELRLDTGGTVGAMLSEIEAAYPGVSAHILDGQGGIRRFINIYVNEEDIRYLKGLKTPLEGSDKVSIMQAVAGG
jgi:molybdopterin converting factor small subunit